MKKRILIPIILATTISLSMAEMIPEETSIKNTLNNYQVQLNDLEVENKRLKFKRIEQLEKEINEKTLAFEKSVVFLKKYKDEDNLNINEELRKIKKEYKIDKASLMKEIEKVKNNQDNDLTLLKIRNQIQEKRNQIDELKNNYIMVKDEYEITKEQITKDFKEKVRQYKIEYKNNLIKLQELYKLQLSTIKSKSEK